MYRIMRIGSYVGWAVGLIGATAVIGYLRFQMGRMPPGITYLLAYGIAAFLPALWVLILTVFVKPSDLAGDQKLAVFYQKIGVGPHNLLRYRIGIVIFLGFFGAFAAFVIRTVIIRGW